MKKIQLLGLGLPCLVISIIIATYLGIHAFTNQDLPKWLHQVVSIAIILALFVFFFSLGWHKRQRIKNDPLYEFRSMLWPTTLLSGTIFIFNFFEEADKQSDSMLLLIIIFFTSLMWTAHKVFKSMQQRIDALEEKLNEKSNRINNEKQ